MNLASKQSVLADERNELIGLDQWIEAKISVPRHDKGVNPYITPDAPISPEFAHLLRAIGFDPIDKDNPVLAEARWPEVTLRVVTWRKANAIHRWVEEVIGPVENVHPLSLERGDLQQLVDDCEAVLASVKFGTPVVHQGADAVVTTASGQNVLNPSAWVERVVDSVDITLATERHLMPQEGFFFGNTTLDEWYVRDLEQTVTDVSRVLEDPRFNDAEFTYTGWW